MIILSSEIQLTIEIELTFINEFFLTNTCDRQGRFAITILPVRE